MAYGGNMAYAPPVPKRKRKNHKHSPKTRLLSSHRRRQFYPNAAPNTITLTHNENIRLGGSRLASRYLQNIARKRELLPGSSVYLPHVALFLKYSGLIWFEYAYDRKGSMAIREVPHTLKCKLKARHQNRYVSITSTRRP